MGRILYRNQRAAAAGFWGGLVPQKNALNASALESLLEVGALGLKESNDFPMSKFNTYQGKACLSWQSTIDLLLVHAELVPDSDSSTLLLV
ncbi:hypothetical protein J5N97_016369 [Dioscorea zingiberensis]|uniref:Uncharacterized protein n=1 Tax=Dioscorea zingiberensis TaxID=325984 RepID=A0A9D5HFC0_9LILI|nr:hypothetical protein J5N97_016369 [Dioscorea zingiberensis]